MAVVIGEESPQQLLQPQPFWHASAPRRVVSEATPDDPFRNWESWRKHLARRANPGPVGFLKGKQPPLLWGWPRAWRREDIRSLLRNNKTKRALALEAGAARILSDSFAAPDLPTTIQLVALTYTLPELSRAISRERWWNTVERLLSLATEAQQHRVDWPADADDVLRQQLLAGELPLALAYLFPEIRPLRVLRKPARTVLTEGLLELTDGQGLPHARLLSALGPLYACWTRCHWIGSHLKRGAWPRRAEIQYEWLVRNAMRLVDKNESFVLTNRAQTAPAWHPNMFRQALAQSGDELDCAAAAAAISPSVVPKRLQSTYRDLPDASLNSDWSGIAVLANGWKQSDVRLAVSYADEPNCIELSAAGGEKLLDGHWKFETTCDEESVTATGEWERYCWESGRRYSYLELGLELSHGLRLERQLLFGRKDRVLYLTDMVIAADDQPRRLRHTLRIPVGGGCSWRPEMETRDGLLAGRKAQAAIMPLALGEWRADPRGGSLTVENNHLILVQEARGRAICCPLFFDLDRKRAKRDRTWRQLTVAEWMESLPHDRAVAYRAQSGSGQWLFYRSLGPVGNRTFLGQNIAGEFSAGSFHDSGQYKEWIEIETL